MDKIRVVVKEVDCPPEVKEIDNDLSTLQFCVNGLIDITELPNHDKIDIICNDEGLYNGSQANLLLPEYNTVICDDVVFAGYDDSDGSTISLTDEQITQVLDYVEKNKVYKMDAASAYCVLQSKIANEKHVNEKVKEWELE